MEKIKVEGMSCKHCVATVEKAIKSIDGVENIHVDLEKKEAEFELKGNVSIEDVKKAVKDAGYKA